MTNDFQAVVYYAIGAFSPAQRAARDSQLLEDPDSEVPQPPGPPVVNAPVYAMTDSLRLMVRQVAHRDDNVSLEIERFQPWWPGNDSSGNPQDPEEAFREWLASAEGQARFGSASAVALHAINVDFESADN